MGHTPYGYRIENGTAVINDQEADCVRRIFDNYISGMSLREAAKAAGHPLVHSTVKRMLTKKYYCGDDFYPAIIDISTFHTANSELKRQLGIQMIPFVLIVDGQGNIVYKHNGYTDGAETELIEKVRELIK